MVEFLSRIRAVDGNIVDLAGNTWTNNSVVVVEDSSIFAPYIHSQSAGRGMVCNISSVSNVYTVAFWGRATDASGSFIESDYFAPGFGRIENSIGFWLSGGVNVDYVSSLQNPTSWHYYSLMYNNGILKIAIDGIIQSSSFNYNFNFANIALVCNGNNAEGYTDICDFVLIDGVELWTKDFTPPTDYLKLPSYAYLSNNNLYTGASLTNLTNNWSGLTNAEKEALVPSFSSEIPSIQDLATISPFRVLTDDTSSENVKVTGQPKSQTIEPTSLINTGAVSTIQSINITNTITDATVKFAITTDLTTYKVYDATQGAWVTSTDIEEDGMSIAQINALTPQILALLDVSNGIAFKQCFIATSENASAELSEISAVVDIDGRWTQSVHDTDYEVAYPNKTTMSVKLKTSGDFIINYPVSEGSIPAPSRFDSNTLFAVSFANGEIEDEIGSTIPTDTTVGLPTIDTTVHKYGTSSAYFDGTKGVGIPYDPKFDFATGDFTIDFWYKQPTTGSIYTNDSACILGQVTSGAMVVFINSSSNLAIGQSYVGYQTTLSFNCRYTDGEFHHFAIVRASGVVYLFIDGVLKESGNNNASYSFTSGGYIGVGNQNLSSSHNGLIGWINGYRISKTARWTSNFTPPTDFYSW